MHFLEFTEGIIPSVIAEVICHQGMYTARIRNGEVKIFKVGTSPEKVIYPFPFRKDDLDFP